MKKLLVLPLVLLLGACTSSIHMSQVSGTTNKSIAESSQNLVQIEKSQHVIMGFAYDTDYVDAAYQELLTQCPSGTSLVNIEYLTNHSFLNWTNKIRIKAACKA
ncbi:hypothetical protein MD588_07010 [Photobacterium sp. SDRW27]|uniref:hypothetical protein n=1 Tax=Photobacterium obscurum TaxID=2829490 RepID=UPI002243C8B3|nr:hypothetical protein [Photobacterium obscurum]MCW8328554.1 hypothetical protein [Photobacterium obscurum]